MSETQFARASEWMKAGRDVALATVIQTRGSSPQSVGGQLVVNDNEAFQGSVSGGCLESTIVTEAQFVIREKRPKRLSIGIDIGGSWDYVLGCGGSIDIFIEPVNPWQPILWELIKRRDGGYPCCLLTNLKLGTKSLVCPEMPHESSAISGKLLLEAEAAIQSGQNRCVCMNDYEHFLHVFLPLQELIIGGAVHIAQTLATIALPLGYQCTIIDPRTAYATKERFPGAKLLCEHPRNLLNHIRLYPNSAVVALSHSPQFDDPLLACAMESGAGYIGALGSKKSHADRLARLKKAGFSVDQVNQIHGPVGLDIGSKSPAEIALSIMAQIFDEKHKSNPYRVKSTCMQENNPLAV